MHWKEIATDCMGVLPQNTFLKAEMSCFPWVCMSLEMFSRKIWGLKEALNLCSVRSELELKPFAWSGCLLISFFYFTAFFLEDCNNVIIFEFSVLSVRSICNCPGSSKVIRKGVTTVQNITLKVFFSGESEMQAHIKASKSFY